MSETSGVEVEQGGGTVDNAATPGKLSAAQLREMLAQAEAEEGGGGAEPEPTPPEEDPYAGATGQYDIPCDQILRPGAQTTIAMRLVEACTLVGVMLAEGIALVGLKLSGKMFDEEACAARRYAGLTILGAQDNLELFVRNVSQEDRQFDGILLLGPHKVIGMRARSFSGAIAPGADAQPLPAPEAVEGADPSFAVRGRRPSALAPVSRPPTPGMPQPMPSQYGGRSGPWAPPPPPDRSTPVRRPGSPPLQRGGGLVEGRPVTPGPNEVALCLTREQAMILYQIVFLGQYVPPFLKVSLKLPLERALS